MKKIKILALIGKAGAGKDYWLQKIVSDDERVHEIISCTTRPPRWMERDGKNYHFLSDNQFMTEHFIESCMFNGWRYGTRYTDLDTEKVNVGVFNLNGIEQLLKIPEIDLTVIYLYTTDKNRLIRQLQRDSSDIEEIFRRYKTDKADFDKQRIQKICEQVPLYTIINNSNDRFDDDNIFISEEIDEIIDKVKNR